MEIIILRHGKPIIPSLARISPLEFTKWVNLYNASGLCSSSKPTLEAIEAANKCKVVVCSELPRSIESAEALNVKEIKLKSSIFNEAGLPISGLKYPALSPKAWAVIFRILWFLGYSNNSESFKEAKVRAKEAAKKLIELAEAKSSILFIGHGVYNRMIANELSASGWLGPKSPGTKHWSYGVYKST